MALFHTIISQEFTGLLYIMSACLIFIMVTAKFVYGHRRRKVLFVLILLVLTYFYIGYEEIHPFVYAIHLIPVCLTLATLFEGVIPGLITWFVFHVCNVAIIGNDWLPAFLGSLLIIVPALVFFHRKYLTNSYRHICLLTLLLITLYLIVFLAFTFPWPLSGAEVAVAVAGTYLSMAFVSYMYYYVKHQERMTEELHQAEKLQMIGQLAASISHEIRNPLTTAKGFLQLLDLEKMNREQFEDYREHAIQGVEAANAIITDYLNYARPTVEKPRPINMISEIDFVSHWIRPLALQSRIQVLITHRTKSPLYIMGESKKIRQCLLNVIKNAIESMGEGGELVIQTWSESDHVYVRIQDSGKGMSDFQIKRIGMPFYTTKEKGTGLGLMVVMSLVKAMNGKITFKSSPKQGTSCLFQFRQVTESGKGSGKE